MSSSTVWVIGAGGLLGSAVVRRLREVGGDIARSTVPWSDADATHATLMADARRLAEGAQPWRVVWAAGAGVVASDAAELRGEVDTFARFLDGLRADGLAPEAIFLTSSAGGVYAGSIDPPFSEATAPRAIAAYGEAKLAMERSLTEYVAATGGRGVIGRISNLYGPGQNVAKPQGLITALCRALIRGDAINIYVPLDTARDYIYVDDAARIVLGCLDSGAGQLPGTTTVKVICAGAAVTVADLLDELHHLANSPLTVTLDGSPLSQRQPRDLRFDSEVWLDLDDLATTTLRRGLRQTYDHLAKQLTGSSLAGG